MLASVQEDYAHEEDLQCWRENIVAEAMAEWDTMKYNAISPLDASRIPMIHLNNLTVSWTTSLSLHNPQTQSWALRVANSIGPPQWCSNQVGEWMCKHGNCQIQGWNRCQSINNSHKGCPVTPPCTKLSALEVITKISCTDGIWEEHEQHKNRMTPSQTLNTIYEHQFHINSSTSNYNIISMPVKHRVALLIFYSYTL